MKRIGVVGAGTMGQGIAASFASNGYQVTVCDIKILCPLPRLQKALSIMLSECTSLTLPTE